MKRIFYAVLLQMAANVLASWPLVAQTDVDQRSCIGLPGGTPDQRIAACTALLETPGSTPNVERAYILRALGYEQKGQFDRAIEDYNQYIRLHPSEPDSWLGRCRAASMTSQLSAALSDCEEALRLSANDPGALYARGLINLKAGRPDAAVRDFTAVLEVQPKNAGAFFLRGTAKLASGNSGGGSADVAAAKVLVPNIADLVQPALKDMPATK
jgi:tetratricopeptide (TPR) repeat protein